MAVILLMSRVNVLTDYSVSALSTTHPASKAHNVWYRAVSGQMCYFCQTTVIYEHHGSVEAEILPDPIYGGVETSRKCPVYGD